MRRSIGIDVNDRLGKGLRGFLRQIVPDATRDGAVRIFAREFARVGARVQMRRAIGIAFRWDTGAMLNAEPHVRVISPSPASAPAR